jgi:hypothetical protein
MECFMTFVFGAATLALTVLLGALIEPGTVRDSSSVTMAWTIGKIMVFVATAASLGMSQHSAAQQWSSTAPYTVFAATMTVAPIVCIYAGTRLGLLVRRRKGHPGRAL